VVRGEDEDAVIGRRTNARALGPVNNLTSPGLIEGEQRPVKRRAELTTLVGIEAGIREAREESFRFQRQFLWIDLRVT
jgi:hypothetical protein